MVAGRPSCRPAQLPQWAGAETLGPIRAFPGRSIRCAWEGEFLGHDDLLDGMQFRFDDPPATSAGGRGRP